MKTENIIRQVNDEINKLLRITQELAAIESNLTALILRIKEENKDGNNDI